MRPADFRDLMAGIKNKITRELTIHKSLRKMAFLSILPHAEKGLSFATFCRDYWPMADDKEIESSNRYDPEMDAELFEQMVKAHGLKLSKQRRKQDN